MSPMDDCQVMDRIREGQVELLALLFERHHRKVFGFFLRLTGDRALSEDLTQELFLRMLKARNTWKSGTAFPPWMYCIARNLHIDHLRRQRPEQASDTLDHAVPDPGPSPTQTLVAQQETALLRRALEALPREKAELLLLSRQDDLSYRDIASMLACSLESVKVQVHRALKELRKHYLALGGTS